MKRKLAAGAQPSQQQLLRSRRQPVTSCLNCRLKKLKCDRGCPCSSCTVRGIPCSSSPSGSHPELHQSAPQSAPQLENGAARSQASILSRLSRLERAVFSHDESDATIGQPSSSPYEKHGSSVSAPQGTTPQDAEAEQTAKFLDSPYTRNDNIVRNPRDDGLRFTVADAALHPTLLGPNAAKRDCRDILMMTKEQAFQFLESFLENPYHMLQIVYEPSVRALINRFYTQLEQGLEADAVAAALILSIASVSASFYCSLVAKNKLFATSEDAFHMSTVWSLASLNILEPVYCSRGRSLEQIQALAILSYVSSNNEGSADRFRVIHSCALAAARNMSLHLTDSPTAAHKSYDHITKEIKRRVWWSIAATDWLLSLLGGSTDGTYLIQPRQFNVRLPRNINNSDLTVEDGSLSHPRTVPTQMTGFLYRVRLGEFCREVADSRAPGFPDVETIDLDKVMYFDRQLDQLLNDQPAFLRQDGPIPPNAPRWIAKQRDLLIVCINVRRARIHRPALLLSKTGGDPRYETSRRQCIASAQTALSVAVGLLDASHDRALEPFGHLLALRVGLIVNAVFMSCAILAVDAGLKRNRLIQQGKDTREAVTEQSDHHTKINMAYQALTKAGEKSTYAAYLNGSLTSILKKYLMKAMDEQPPDSRSTFINNVNEPHAEAAAALTAMSDTNTAVPIASNGDSTMQQQQQQQSFTMYNGNDNEGIFDNLEMWNQFFSVMPDSPDAYGHIFEGLDFF
ncbi:hypothetical protein F5Y16DRAFT_110711 [Xylariaceae sp. FL0255]|nr:hypothetical protein F5Y16DRAFT_110711 [Xylariaceae sp. FL0255]